MINLVKGRNDIWMWNDGEDKAFSVKSAYKKVQGPCAIDNQCFFDFLWRLKVIPSAKLFVWWAISNGVPTMVNLRLIGSYLTMSLVLCAASRKRP